MARRRLACRSRSFSAELKSAGLGTLPGTAAEILDDEARQLLCPDKVNTVEWLEVMRAAHETRVPFDGDDHVRSHRSL